MDGCNQVPPVGLLEAQFPCLKNGHLEVPAPKGMERLREMVWVPGLGAVLGKGWQVFCKNNH